MSKKKFPPRFPLFAHGIRSQETRSGVGKSWWSRRWLSVIERMNLGSRLGRGRNYAFSGQVQSLKLAGPHVEALVLGARPTPYRVTIDFRIPDDAAMKRIVNAIASEPIRVARLIAGDMPTEMEMFFCTEGFGLFPGGKISDGVYDMTISCSCPDWANPCKHSVAVLMLLGEEIARRPMTLLELRGICEEDLMR